MRKIEHVLFPVVIFSPLWLAVLYEWLIRSSITDHGPRRVLCQDHFPSLDEWSDRQVDRLLSDILTAPNPNHDCDPGDCTDADS